MWAALVFAAGSVLNPAYFAGCGAGDDDARFEYGAEEVVALLDQANDEVEVDAADVAHCSTGQPCMLSEVPYRVEIELAPDTAAQAAAEEKSASTGWLGMRAHACGNRRLFASASACIDYSSMDVHGHLKITRLDADAETVVVESDVEGSLRVVGMKLSNADVSLQFEGGTLSFRSLDGQQFQDHRLTFKR